MTLNPKILTPDYVEILNKSYRTGVYSKVFNSVIDPNSFTFQSGKRNSYTQRLYFEYMYTQKVKGTTYFYTLTYNDAAIPHYFSDRPCFSYQDIRKVTNGALSKELERKYGSRLRYFIACETGEGKGSRGAGKNPHYHCIFFVQPLHDSDNNPIYDGYKVIQPLDFRRIIRRVWQGTENDYVNFNECKFGICKEGDNCGLVSGIAPFKYCSKYVLKDNNELALENDVYNYWKEYSKNEGLSSKVLFFYYRYMSFIEGETARYLYEDLGISRYNKWRHYTNDPDKSYSRFITRYCDINYIKISATKLNDFYTEHFCVYYAKYKLNEYKNLYSGKVRCSKSLGEYGLQFVKNKEYNPVFNIPKNDGFDCQNISQYYYRKLYYRKYICDVTGNVLYRLNDLGKCFKVNSLSNTIEKHTIAVKEALSIVFNNHFLCFNEERENKIINQLVENPIRDEILYRYSVYKTVYEYRHFYKDDLIALDPCYSIDSVKTDYIRFIQNDSFFLNYETTRLIFRLSHSDSTRSFASHPNFFRYRRIFKALDDMLEHVRQFRSDNSKSIFKANSELAARIKASRI